MSNFSDRARLFEEYLRDGISAVKSGQKKLAQSLLNRAIYMNGADARPFLWLSATTDDPAQQREYLEQAVSIDPANAAARRGLALLTGKIDKTRLMEQGAVLDKGQISEEVEARGVSYQCPQCGGKISFSLQNERGELSRALSCEYCGYSSPVEKEDGVAQTEAGSRSVVNARLPGDIKPMDLSATNGSVADSAEQTLDFVMPTTRGHRWSEAQQLLICASCGALNVLPPGWKTTSCSYCGADQLVESAESVELVDPQVIALMRIDEQQAIRSVRQWLKTGVFTPDNLAAANRGLQLRPAYYSFWTFDGTVELRWSCEVDEGTGQARQWGPMNGTESRFFDDVLVSGVKALIDREVESAAPFNLTDVEEFQPEYLAGWTAILYDRSLSDASLLAREKVIRRIRPQLNDLIAIGRRKRNVNIGSSNWSGMTFKHILLPLWTGTYQYQSKKYRLLVNGQTGKVGGVKPRDKTKLALTVLIVIMLSLLIIILLWSLVGFLWRS